ncbi:hypothetical protein H632_c704p1 [Helicosporidium sp. ATCC 50920]|nr:hypothetical protein H632_c704p1 [Helicosporidium sp. ATCC 50920]|eukprot:KDD75396.1 hypothetical protein H632_c704p1 [Helicosporidium sp. ATCC 50920]
MASKFTPEEEHQFMGAALEQAQKAQSEDEIPVGCVLVRQGKIVARGSNRTNQSRNGTRHAEFEAADALLAAHAGDVEAAAFGRCTLFVTCEPCIMCAGALALLGIGRVVYGCPNDKFGGNGSIVSGHDVGCGRCEGAGGGVGIGETGGGRAPGSAYPSKGGVRAAEAVSLLQRFYEAGNPNGA